MRAVGRPRLSNFLFVCSRARAPLLLLPWRGGHSLAGTCSPCAYSHAPRARVAQLRGAFSTILPPSSFFAPRCAAALNPVFSPSPSRSTFWEKNYAQVLHLHPSFSFMLRPAPEMAPYMLVEYGACDTLSLLRRHLSFPSPNALPPAPRSRADYAHSVKVSLEGLDEAAIEKKVSNAARQTSCSLVGSPCLTFILVSPRARRWRRPSRSASRCPRASSSPAPSCNPASSSKPRATARYDYKTTIESRVILLSLDVPAHLRAAPKPPRRGAARASRSQSRLARARSGGCGARRTEARRRCGGTHEHEQGSAGTANWWGGQGALRCETCAPQGLWVMVPL
jgi:hypothetical protein